MTETELREPYELHKIKFTKDEVIWLLSILPLLRQGFWPESLEIKGNSKSAYFRTPIELAAEMDTRLEKTGIDGAMAEAHYSLYRDFGSLAKQYHLSYNQVQAYIHNAVKYMSGWRRKRRDYREWCNHRKGGEHGMVIE